MVAMGVLKLTDVDADSVAGEFGARNPTRDKRLEYNRLWMRRRREHDRDYALKHRVSKYGLSCEDFENLRKMQDGKCAICQDVFVASKRLHVDHNHSTGKVRGLLCSPCNRGLGQFGDDVNRLEKALAYLRAR